jgi:hypothetical protein
MQKGALARLAAAPPLAKLRHLFSVRTPEAQQVFGLSYPTVSFMEIPYFDGCRPETVQRPGSTDTSVVLTDPQGVKHEFASSEENLRFYAASGREV